MADIPVTWKFQEFGADQVKTKLRELNTELEKQEVDIDAVNKKYKELRSATNLVTSSSRLQSRAYLAQHPNLLKLSRAMSTVSSVSRTALTISNALNLAFLRQGSSSSQMISAQADLNALMRDFNKETDPIRKGELSEQISILKARIKELGDAETSGAINDVVTAIGSIGLAFHTAIKIATNKELHNTVRNAGMRLGQVFGGAFSGFSTMIIRAGAWLSTALNGVITRAGISGSIAGTAFGAMFHVAAVAGLVGVIAASIDSIVETWTGTSIMKEIGKKLGFNLPSVNEIFGNNQPKGSNILGVDSYEQWQKGGGKSNIGDEKGVKKQVDAFQPLIDLFTTGLPEAFGETEESFDSNINVAMTESTSNLSTSMKEGWVGMWNGVINITNMAGRTLTDATNSIFRSLINHINSLISAYNRAAAKIGRSSIAKVSYSAASYADVPVIAAARGFDGMVNGPQMFLAGEAGPEHVSITPSSGGGRGGVINQYVTVQGSVITERELIRKIDKKFMTSLKSRGFTGV